MNIPASKWVNKIGKYMYKHIASATSYKISGNMNDIYFTVLYEYPIFSKDPNERLTYSDTFEMKLNLNITTYQNKIRINLIEVSPDEQTLGYFLYPTDSFIDMKKAFDQILRDIDRRLNKVFENYTFIY